MDMKGRGENKINQGDRIYFIYLYFLVCFVFALGSTFWPTSDLKEGNVGTKFPARVGRGRHYDNDNNNDNGNDNNDIYLLIFASTIPHRESI